MNLETLVLELVADDSQLSRDIDGAVNKAMAKLSRIERVGAINPKVNAKALHDLNKLLDVKQDHLSETVEFYKKNPIVIGVDTSEVDDAEKKIDQLESKQKRQSQSKGESSKKGSDGTLYGELEDKLTGEIKGVVDKLGSIVTAPLAGIGRGFFEGFGQSISKELSQGFMSIFSQDLNIDLKDMGKKVANSTISYAFPNVQAKKKEADRIKQYQSQMDDVDDLLGSVSKSVSKSKGLDKEKAVIDDLKQQSKTIKENLRESNKTIGAKGIPSNAEVIAMGQQVNLQIDAIAKLSATLNAVSGQISAKLKQYRDAEKLIGELSNRLDLAVNSNDYKQVRQIKNDISSQLKTIGYVGDDPVMKGYRDRLIEYQRGAKVDGRLIAKTSNAPTIRDYLTQPKTSMELMAEKGKITAQSMGGDVVKTIVEGVKATARGAIGGGRALYGGLEAAESLALGPAKHVLKPLIQGTVIAGGLPLAASTFPALAPVAQMMGGVGQMGGSAIAHAVGGQMAGFSSIPVIGGQLTAALTGATTAAGGFVTEMVAGVIALRTVVKGFSSIWTSEKSPVVKAIAPSQEQPKLYGQIESAGKSATKKLSGLIEKAQNLDAYLPTLPEGQRDLVAKYLPQAAAIKQANQGDFIPANVSVPGLKQITPADYKNLDVSMQSAVQSDLIAQYKSIQKTLFEFGAKVRDSISPLDRMKGEIGTLTSAFKAQKKRLEKQADSLGIDVSKYKMSDDAFKGVTLNADAVEMPNISKLQRAASVVESNWGKTSKSVQEDMWEMTETAKKQAYPLQKNMSEGSPGPTDWIRKNWKKTADYVNKQIESMTATTAKMFTQTKSNAGRMGIDYNKFPVPKLKTIVKDIDGQTQLLSSPLESPTNATGDKRKRRQDYNINANSIDLPFYEMAGYERPRPNAKARKELVKKIDDASYREDLETVRKELIETINYLKDIRLKLSKKAGATNAVQIKAIDNEIKSLNSRFSRQFQTLGNYAGNLAGEGTEEYYDNFLGSLKSTLIKKLRLKGQAAEGLIDQIMTFAVAGATTFAPGLAPAIAAAPLAMPLIPAALASLGIGTLIAPVIKRIDQALIQQEPIKQRFTTLEGNPIAGASKQGDVTNIARKYSIPVEPAVQNFSQMAIAARGTNLTAKEMLDLFEGISASIRALGLSTQDADLIFMAYTQMLAKGKISMEELRQQLGERFPPAMSVFAKALNTTTAGLDDMVSRGAIGTEKWVTSVTKVLKEDFGTAALAMGDNYAAATTRIENLNFEINKNFADTYGGLFTVVKNAWGGILSIFSGNFKILNALAVSGLIAVWASIGIGVSYIMKTPAIANMAKGGSNLLFSVFKNTLGTLTPFLIGTIADVMDDVLGAENSVMENMSKGIGNMFVAAFGGVDRMMRDSGMGAMFDPFISRDNPFDSVTNGLKGLIKTIPSGVVEMLALVLMFEQVRVLGQMFLMPTLNNLTMALGRWGKAVKEAVINASTMKRTIADLFGGTLISLSGVTKSDVMSRFSGDFKTMRKELDSSLDSLTQYKQKRDSIIRGYQSDYSRATGSTITRDKAIADNQQELRQLKQQYQSRREIMMGDGDISPEKDALVRYQSKRDELLSRRTKQMAAQRLAMGASMIAAEAALAIGVMAFARSDFSNNIEAESNKARKSMIGNIEAMKSSLKTLSTQALGTGKTLGTIKLPSKGLELSLPAIFLGQSDQSFKSDDLVLKHRQEIQKLTKEYEELSKSTNPFMRFWAEIAKKPMVSNPVTKEKIKQATDLGLGDFYPSQAGLPATIAENQLLDSAIGFQKQMQDIKNTFKNDSFDINDLSKPFDVNTQKAVQQVKSLDLQLMELGKTRSELGLKNDVESRKAIGNLDQEMNALFKQRKELAKPFIDMDTSLKAFEKDLQSQLSAIDNEPIPQVAKNRLKDILQPQLDLVNNLKSYFAGQGISDIAKPLEDVWDRIVNKIQDVQSALEKLKASNTIGLNNANAQVYNQGGGNMIVNRKVQQLALQGYQKDYNATKTALDENQKALAEALSISNVGDASEKRAKVEELRKTVREQSIELSGLASSMAKAKYDLAQDFGFEDYYRNTARQVADLKLQINNQRIQDQRSIEDLAIQFRDASRSLQISNRGLIDSYKDMGLDFNIQIATIQKSLADAKDQIKLSQLKAENLSITPGNSQSAAKQVNDIVLRFAESVFNTQTNERQIKIDILNLEKERIGRLRQIREFEERQQQAQIDYENQVRTLNRAKLDLERSLTKSAGDLARAFDDLVRSIKRADSTTPEGKRLLGALMGIGRPTANVYVPQVTQYAIESGTGRVVNQQAYMGGLRSDEIALPTAPVYQQPQMAQPVYRNPGDIGILQDAMNNNQSGRSLTDPVYQGQVFNNAVNSLETAINSISPQPQPVQQPKPVPQIQSRVQPIQPIGVVDAKALLGENYNLLRQLVAAEETNGTVAQKTVVARSALNRTALLDARLAPNGTAGYGTQTPTLRGVIMGRTANGKAQYSPVDDGRINNKFSAKVLAESDQAIVNALNDQKMLSMGLNPALLDVTNFQRTDLGNPGWWKGGVYRLGEHSYSRDRYSVKSDPSSLLNQRIQNRDSSLRSSLNFGIPESIKLGQTAQAKNSYAGDFNQGVPKLELDQREWTTPSNGFIPANIPAVTKPEVLNPPALRPGVFNKPPGSMNNPDVMGEINKELKGHPEVKLNGNAFDINNLPAPVQQNTEPLKQQAARITVSNEQLKQLEKQRIDIQAEIDFRQAFSDLKAFRIQLEDTFRQNQQTYFDQGLSINQLTRNAKGFLTIFEQADQSATDVFMQYENLKRQIASQRLANDRLIEKKEDLRLSKELAYTAALAKGHNADQLATEINLINAQLDQYETQNDILDAQEKQLDANQKNAAATALNNTFLEKQLALVDGYVGKMAELSTAKYNLGGTLVNDGAILQARLMAATASKRAEREGKNNLGLQGEELAQYVAMAQEIADINLQQSFSEAVPFVKELGANLKEAVFQTNNFTEALTKTLDLIATTVFDQLVLKPFTNFLAQQSANLFGYGQQAIPEVKPASFLPTIFNMAIPFIGAKADGLDQVMGRESAQTGRSPMLAVVNDGEAILSTLNGDAQKFQALKRSGNWDKIPNFANGSDRLFNQSRNYQGNWENLVNAGGANTSQSVNNSRTNTVNKFNQTYVINTPNADSFRKSQAQIQDEGARNYRRKMR